MHYKTNRLNHDFQIAYFLAGSCQTADAAYALLCDLKEDRSNALKMFESHKMREQAKIMRAERRANDPALDEADRLEAQADLSEISAMAETTLNNYKAAQAELEFIEKCQAALEPYRKYAHLPDAIAHEAAQQEEWALQLIHTAENMMLSGVGIPHDQWAVMRTHPEFATKILPQIEATKQMINGATPQNSHLLTAHLQRRTFKLPELPKQLTSEEVEQQKLLSASNGALADQA